MKEITMHDLTRTPQTLPYGDKDPFFFLDDDDDSIDDHKSLGERMGRCDATSIERKNGDSEESLLSYFLVSSHQMTEGSRKQQNGGEDSIRSSRSLPVTGSTQNRRRFYRGTTRSKLSTMIKVAMQSSAKVITPDKSSWTLSNRNHSKDKDRIYYSLDEKDEPNLNDCDDPSVSLSLPALSIPSLPWKKKQANDESSSPSTPMLPRSSKPKWNRILHKGYLATMRSPEPSRSSYTVKANKSSSIPVVELSSSSSTASSAASCNSAPTITTTRIAAHGDADRFLTQSPRLTSLLQKGLYSSRVDEEDEEDTSIDDDDHPAAGSFDFALGRGEF